MSSIAVFGASRGIGASFAKNIATKYQQVYLFDISESIFELREELQGQDIDCHAYVLDVSDTEMMEKYFNEAFAQANIDHICYFIRSKNKPSFTEITPQEWDFEFDITLKAAFFTVQKALPYLSKSEKGSVVFVSSICAQQIGPETVSYHAAKAGLENLTKYLAVNLGRLNIRVNAARLGFIVQNEHLDFFYSEGNKNYRQQSEDVHPLKRIGHVEDVIAPIEFLLSAQAGFITGHILNVDGGLSLRVQSDIALQGVTNNG